MILPRVKHYMENEGSFKSVIVYDGNCEISSSAVELMRLFSPDLICKKGR